MEQYIQKSALVAEIEKYYNECLKRAKIIDSDYWNAKADAYRNVLVILDSTLEVKEVDLEDAVDDARDLAMRDMAWKVHVMISEGKSIREIDHYVCGICDF